MTVVVAVNMADKLLPSINYMLRLCKLLRTSEKNVLGDSLAW